MGCSDLVPGIHVNRTRRRVDSPSRAHDPAGVRDVDGRDKPGHDGLGACCQRCELLDQDTSAEPDPAGSGGPDDCVHTPMTGSSRMLSEARGCRGIFVDSSKV